MIRGQTEEMRRYQQALKLLDGISPKQLEKFVVKMAGVDVELERLSGCVFYWLRFSRDGTEFYRIDRDGETRYEAFFGVIARRYEGNRFSFCEYSDILTNEQQFPDTERVVREGVDMQTAKMYEAYARRALGIKP